VCISQYLLHFLRILIKYPSCHVQKFFLSQTHISLLVWEVIAYKFIVLLTCKTLYVIKNRESNKSVCWGWDHVRNFLHRSMLLNLIREILSSYVCSESCTAILQDNFAFRYKWFSVSGKICSWREQSKWTESRKQILVESRNIPERKKQSWNLAANFKVWCKIVLAFFANLIYS
jgi:hypothetical protein